MNISCKVFLRKDFVKSNGTCRLYLQLIVNRKIRRFALSIFISPKDWNESKCEVKKTHPNHFKYNLLIKHCLQKANNIIFDYQINDKFLTFDGFKRSFYDESLHSDSLFDFIENEIKTLLNDKFSSETIRGYKSQISKLKTFRKEIKFNDIDVNFLDSYQLYMIKTKNNCQNTANKSLTFLRNVINKAIKKGLIKENVFRNYSVSKKEGKREFLTLFEVGKLQKFYDDGKYDKYRHNVLRYFLFSCYTGLRYQDIRDFKFKNIQEVSENSKIISLVQHKTDDYVRIPLIDKALKLIDNDGLDNQRVFKVLSNQPTNRYLKEIIKEAGINKEISFHCARHTFATVGIDIGMPIEVVSKILGHRDLKTTLIYAKITDKLKIKEMEKWNV